MRVDPPPLLVAMRCAVCGRGFSAEVYDQIILLKELFKRPTPPGALFALTCNECGSGGKAWKDGVLVNLKDALVPMFGPEEEEENR